MIASERIAQEKASGEATLATLNRENAIAPQGNGVTATASCQEGKAERRRLKIAIPQGRDTTCRAPTNVETHHI